MKSLLFWKILIGFWLTFIIVNQANALLYQLISDEPPYFREVREDFAVLVLGAGKSAIELGGKPAFDHLLESLPDWQQEAFKIQPHLQDSPIQEDPNVMSQVVSDPQEKHWLLYVELPSATQEFSVIETFKPPLELLRMSTVGAFFFSAALAFYLTRPVQRLRKGFQSLAAGDLTIRLQSTIGRRRDEIADLAKDFDQMAARLQQLVQVRDQLLHDVSHELRSPLARLSQAIALLRRDPANMDASLSRIETEIRRLDELVGELLSLARAESGEAHRDQYFDLPALVEAVVKNAEFEASAKGIAVDAQSAISSEGVVRGNGELMRRALENVVRNALNVSEPGQRVEIKMSADTAQDQYVVTVADAGPGVARDNLHTMFDPFVRLDDATPRKGYGLGLAIARRAVLALGGTIDAQNRPDHGLVVTMRLPIHPFSATA